MKKTIKILYMFLFLFGVFFVMQINDNNAVKAVNGVNCVTGGLCKQSNDQGYITDDVIYTETRVGYTDTLKIRKNGDVVISYKYGYTEVLIVYETCRRYGTNTVGEEEVQVCYEFGGNDSKIVSYSGGINKSDSPGTRLFTASKYYDTDTILRVSVITEFIGEISDNSYTGPYTPIFCYQYTNSVNCNNPKSTKERMKTLNVQLGLGISEVNMVQGDINKIIYKGSSATSSNPNTKFVFANIVTLVQLGEDTSISELITDTIIPVLLAVLGVLAIVTSVTLGYQIVKLADEPEERSEKIKKLRNIIIGLAAVAVVLIAYEPVYEFAKELIQKQK